MLRALTPAFGVCLVETFLSTWYTDDRKPFLMLDNSPYRVRAQCAVSVPR